jgi:cellulose synthase (UDP-forming)
MIGIALLILLDVPKPDLYEWFNLRRLVRLDVAKRTLWGVTTRISEVGAEVALTQAELPPLASGETLPMKLEILEEAISLEGQITQTKFTGEFPTVRVIFEQVTLSQQRRLVEMLFCRPGTVEASKYTGRVPIFMAAVEDIAQATSVV